MNVSLRSIHKRGRCTGSAQHHLFFSELPSELARAQEICAGCPVRAECLALALSEGYEWGVWGGVIFWDGRPYQRRRGRGRPKASDSSPPIEADRAELWERVKSA